MTTIEYEQNNKSPEILPPWKPNTSYEEWLISYCVLKEIPRYAVRLLASDLSFNSSLSELNKAGVLTQEMLEMAASILQMFGKTYAFRYFLRVTDGFGLHLNRELLWEVRNPDFDPLMFGELYTQALTEFGKRAGMKFAYEYHNVAERGVHPQVFYDWMERAANKEEGGDKVFAGWFARGLADALEKGEKIPQYFAALQRTYRYDRANQTPKLPTLKTFLYNFPGLVPLEGSVGEFADSVIQVSSDYSNRVARRYFDFLHRSRDKEEYGDMRDQLQTEMVQLQEKVWRKSGLLVCLCPQNSAVSWCGFTRRN